MANAGQDEDGQCNGQCHDEGENDELPSKGDENAFCPVVTGLTTWSNVVTSIP